MKIDYKDGLLFTNIDIIYKGKSKTINNVVIDTGAAGSIISPDCVEDIGIYAEANDKIMQYYGVGGSIHSAFVKNIDLLKMDCKSVQNLEIDFGLIDQEGKINGLLGLDILVRIGAIIDLNELEIRL